MALLEDKGYDTKCHSRGPCSPENTGCHSRQIKSAEKIDHDRAIYRQPNRIELTFGRLKISRAIATRYDQMPSSFVGTAHLETIRF